MHRITLDRRFGLLRPTLHLALWLSVLAAQAGCQSRAAIKGAIDGVGDGADNSGGAGSGADGGDASGADGSAAGTLACVGGTTQCGNRCVDLRSSENHCGACGNACASGGVCTEGVCSVACGADATACGGACVDTLRNPQHCGACDLACGSGEVCDQGECSLACGSGATACAGSCVSLLSANQHCGACGNACLGDERCIDGSCEVACYRGSTACADQCVNTQADHDNCGGCGNVCQGDQQCVSGACVANCTGGSTLCGDRCVDTNNDPDHCGVCANACHPADSCAGGGCLDTCPGDFERCTGVCTDTQTNAAHCGACGNSCGSNRSCNGGACGCAPGLSECPALGPVCRDLQTDPTACGACNVVCGGNQFCRNGACQNRVSCTVGQNLFAASDCAAHFPLDDAAKFALCGTPTEVGRSLNTDHDNNAPVSLAVPGTLPIGPNESLTIDGHVYRDNGDALTTFSVRAPSAQLMDPRTVIASAGGAVIYSTAFPAILECGRAFSAAMVTGNGIDYGSVSAVPPTSVDVVRHLYSGNFNSGGLSIGGAPTLAASPSGACDQVCGSLHRLDAWCPGELATRHYYRVSLPPNSVIELHGAMRAYDPSGAVGRVDLLEDSGNNLGCPLDMGLFTLDWVYRKTRLINHSDAVISIIVAPSISAGAGAFNLSVATQTLP